MLDEKIDIPASDISKKDDIIEEKEDKEKLYNTIEVSKEPQINEIIHSNMVDFENFKLKDESEVKTEKPEEKIEELKDSKKDDDSDYDDFFDDFFFEE